MLCKDAYEAAKVIEPNRDVRGLVVEKDNDCIITLVARRVTVKFNKFIIDLDYMTITITPGRLNIEIHATDYVIKRSVSTPIREVSITPLPDGSVIGVDIH